MPRSKDSGTTKGAVRERRARRAKNERLTRWRRRAILLLALALAAGGVAWSGLPGRALYAAQQSWFRTTAGDGMVVRNVFVEGRQNIDAAQLRSVLGIKAGDPLMGVDPQDEAAALRRLSWVRDVRVERRLPDTIYIALTERTPLALWQDHGKLRLIDADGVVLTDQNLQKFAGLPLVVGDDAPVHAAALLQQLATFPGLGAQADSASWLEGQRWDVHLKNGQTLQLPPGDVAPAFARLQTAEGKEALADKTVTVIDLRQPDRITVRTAPLKAPP